MFLRIRWFTLGVVSAIGGGAYLFAKVRALRARLSPDNLRRAAGHAVADSLGAAGRIIAPGSPDGAQE